MSRAGKASVLCMVTVLTLTGCQKGEEQEEYLYRKTQEDTLETVESDVTQGDLAQLLQAPEHYRAEFAGDKVTVRADAKMEIPQAEGVKSYRVTSRLFEREDYDRVCDTFFAGNGKELFDTGWETEDWMYGEVEAGDSRYQVSLTNRMDDQEHRIEMSVENMRAYGSVFLAGTQEKVSRAQTEAIPDAEYEALAQGYVKAMGLVDFGIAGKEYGLIQQMRSKKTETEQAHAGYAVYFTRVVDGIPLTYTEEAGNAVEGAWASWPYERLTFVFDEQGLVAMYWCEPCELERTSGESLFLLPFSDIQSVFERMMLEKYDTFFGEIEATAEFEISEIRFGYMRTHEKGNTTEGTLIPVWDFLGKETITYAGEEEPYIEGAAADGGDCHKSLLTIHAVDGTILDRGLGY
jgi:uncharacterized lipoprotein